RAEDFLLGDLHVIGDVVEHRGLDEVALAAAAIAADEEFGAFLLAGFDEPHDAIELLLGNLRPLRGLRIEGIADLLRLGFFQNFFDKLVVDLFLDEKPAAGTAALALVEEQAEVSALDGGIDIGIGKDDVGALAAQFEADALEVALGGRLHDDLAGGVFAG